MGPSVEILSANYEGCGYNTHGCSDVDQTYYSQDCLCVHIHHQGVKTQLIFSDRYRWVSDTSLLKYFQITNSTLPKPDGSSPLSTGTGTAAANKEVWNVLDKVGSHQERDYPTIPTVSVAIEVSAHFKYGESAKGFVFLLSFHWFTKVFTLETYTQPESDGNCYCVNRDWHKSNLMFVHSVIVVT